VTDTPASRATSLMVDKAVSASGRALARLAT
jgi:hypothetical protein